jgi:hypothetical protein
MQKYSTYPEMLVTNWRVLNHKRKDFWNLSLSNKQSLPPIEWTGHMDTEFFHGARANIDVRDF